MCQKKYIWCKENLLQFLARGEQMRYALHQTKFRTYFGDCTVVDVVSLRISKHLKYSEMSSIIWFCKMCVFQKYEIGLYVDSIIALDSLLPHLVVLLPHSSPVRASPIF